VYLKSGLIKEKAFVGRGLIREELIVLAVIGNSSSICVSFIFYINIFFLYFITEYYIIGSKRGGGRESSQKGNKKSSLQ
jgi:hypothetical protein